MNQQKPASALCCSFSNSCFELAIQTHKPITESEQEANELETTNIYSK